MKSKSGLVYSRKSQMTVFVIIGLMILFTFVALQMLTRQTAQIQLRESTQKLIVDLLKSGALPYYVNTCLDRSLKDGLVLAGQQGGNIYSFQNGSVALPSKYLSMSGVLNGQPVSVQVAYGISMPPLVNDTVYPFPPGYPGGVGKSQQVPKLEWKNFGRFGEVTLRRLCDAFGANKPFAVGVSAGFTPICLNNMYADVESTQWQLEEFIRKRLHGCVNWSAIAQETAYNVTSLDEPNITLRLGDVDVWVDAFYPIRVKVGGREPVSTVADFHVREPVRLKHVVEIASFMSIYDSYSLNWNISEHTMQLPFWDSFMSLRVFKYPLPDVWHDVVELQDDASRIDGQPFVFRFVRENRYPVLDYIHEVSENQTYDIITIENNTVWIMPNPDWSKIYDPDEDDLAYDYTGWKETCDEPFDFVNGLNVYTCSNEMRRPEEFLPQNARDPGNWTKSESYQKSHRNASIVTGHSDIGPHNVTVWVCDEEGLCDYQVVRIMVYDIPELHFKTVAVYNDTDDSSASVEDPFRLDASGTATYFSPLITYVFTDKTEPFEMFTVHPLMILEVPGVPYNISNIVDFNFSKAALGLEKSKKHKIEFTVSPALPSPLINEITVYQCLPHRNSQSFAWPYNTVDPFEADHTCCSNGTGEFGTDPNVYLWGSYLPSTAVCYTAMPLLGVYSSFKDEAGAEGLVTNTVIEDGGTKLAPGEGLMKNYGNDVFVRVFERACSGDRGNTCTGVGTDTRLVLQKCVPDKKDGDVEFCSGPSDSALQAAQGLALSKNLPPACLPGEVEVKGKCYSLGGVSTGCMNYGVGESFDKLFGPVGQDGKRMRADGTPATGICNEGPKCTDGVVYEHGKGNKLSNAKCAGDGTGCSKVNVFLDCDTLFSDCKDLKKEANRYVAYKKKCQVSEGGVGDCVESTEGTYFVNVDDDVAACAKCAVQGKVGKGLKLPGDQLSCCGDDKGEGGFPYKRVASGASSSVKDYPAGAPFLLTYTKGAESDCSDAGSTEINTPQNTMKAVKDYWIDNDCDGKRNCEDSDCYPSKNPAAYGPSGGRCCGAAADCKTVLPGSECGTNLECDCKATGTSFAAPEATVNALGMKTGCIAGTLETLLGQKILRFIGLAGTRTFNVVFTPYVQGTTCTKSGIMVRGPGPAYTFLNEGNSDTPFSVDVGAEFFVVFKAAAENDCKYTLTIT